MDTLGQLLPFLVIAALFWFLLIRPQRRRQMDLLTTQRNLVVGDEVLLGAGIVGRVVQDEDEFLHVEIAPGVAMKVARGAVVRVLEPQEPESVEPLDPPDGPTDPPVEERGA